MKKAFKYYFFAWAVMFVLFNIVVIALPKEVTIAGFTYTKLGGLSWIILILFEICFIAHLFCTAVALRQNKLSGTFYRLPLIRLSYGCLILTVILGCIAMAVPALPSWIPLIITLIITAVYIMAVLKAAAAAELVENIDENVRANTSFIRDLTVDASALMSRAKSDEVKAACKKVYEALRYSDPMSSEALADVEGRIKAEFAVLADAVLLEKEDALKSATDELLILITERNQACKINK